MEKCYNCPKLTQSEYELIELMGIDLENDFAGYTESIMFWGAIKIAKKNIMTKLTLMNKLAKLTELFEKNDNGEPKVIVYPQENPFRGPKGFTKLT